MVRVNFYHKSNAILSPGDALLSPVAQANKDYPHYCDYEDADAYANYPEYADGQWECVYFWQGDADILGFGRYGYIVEPPLGGWEPDPEQCGVCGGEGYRTWNECEDFVHEAFRALTATVIAPFHSACFDNYDDD